MKIAISGAHSQGKTTLVNDLALHERFRKFTVLGNITRGIKELGVEINEGGSDWSQILVTAKHIEHFFFKGDAILDRCMLDGVVYTDVLHQDNRVTRDVRNHAVHVFNQLVRIKKYDILFYVEPTLPLVWDDVRSNDALFFRNVKDTFNAYIDGYNIDVIKIQGSRQERVESVIKALDKKFKS